MKREDLQDKEKVQAAVRQVADEYLRDPNITSVGIGYKESGGQPTGELVLKFTVGQKVAPELLQTVPTRPIPETITANGIEFETDVVERTFAPQPIPVLEATKSDRKTRRNPIVPGISIGHVHVTAGTLGCVVADAKTGEPLILSNWHVLHGATGQLGDPIVQPGPADDNRVAENKAGVLVRSFVGLAGDCALARPSGRRIDDEVLDLGVAVRRLADPELGDVVVKSGRTTDVTYGVVTRVHTITKITYGGVGEQEIGGFEIGPDPDHPAPNEEISMGGDSGSAWLAVDGNGDATDLMLGLHFAGETGGEREFALACYASSVFAKLEITPRDVAPGIVGIVVSREGEPGPGFDEGFLTHSIALPGPDGSDIEDDYARTRSDELVRRYTHFSLAMSASRRFARWVAWNIDGNSIKLLPRTGIDFVTDPEYAVAHQVDDRLYSKNPLDRGHIARRADLVWGELDEAQRANVDSFFFTNITPQLDDFNQSARRGIWGKLENVIFEEVEVDDLRVSVLGGPIFGPDDFPYRGILVPRSFWKIVAYVEGGALRAKAFVLTQDDLESNLEALPLDDFKVFQVTLEDLRQRTRLTFGALTEADTMTTGPEALPGVNVRRVRSPADFV